MAERYAGRHRGPERFTVLFVCTGNICRSPYAELLTRHLMIGAMGDRAATGFDVASAGVRAVVGAPMHPRTRRELAPWGLDAERFAGRFRARSFDADLAAGADLVLALDLSHRTAIVEQAPEALPITFGLREFARLLAAADRSTLPDQPTSRAQALLGLARSRRTLVPPVERTADEVPDPMGGSQSAHHRAARLIMASVRTIVDILTVEDRAGHVG